MQIKKKTTLAQERNRLNRKFLKQNYRKFMVIIKIKIKIKLEKKT